MEKATVCIQNVYALKAMLICIHDNIADCNFKSRINKVTEQLSATANPKQYSTSEQSPRESDVA